jgi:hypothetical protein
MSPFQEALRLYYRQKMAQHSNNKEMSTVSAVFPLFSSAPVYLE